MHKRPPDRRTRHASAIARSGLGMCKRPKPQITASKVSSSNVSFRHRLRESRPPETFAVPLRSLWRAKSRPTAVPLRSTACPAAYPGPQATSSTRVFAPTRAASRRGADSPGRDPADPRVIGRCLCSPGLLLKLPERDGAASVLFSHGSAPVKSCLGLTCLRLPLDSAADGYYILSVKLRAIFQTVAVPS